MGRRAGARVWPTAIASVIMGAALAGCAAGQAGKARPSGFLGDYAQLREGGEGQALLVYVDPSVRFSTYRKMIIDPVTIWRDAGTKDIPPDEAQDLIDDLDDVLRMTLDDDYQLVKEPGPDVLRLRVAITEAEGSWRVVDGRLGDELDEDLRAVKTKEPSDATKSFVGKAGVEAEILDSTSGKRLAAAIDRRVGARTLKPEKNAWSDVERAFRYWADRLRDRLGELRKRS
ncbi:MAG: DUF3313 domain-containing protein [Deltaproteobacteria bacterium]|nr:DUF3313 domain-containing protein [Deltaproteobacteria bacterium]